MPLAGLLALSKERLTQFTDSIVGQDGILRADCQSALPKPSGAREVPEGTAADRVN